MDLEKEKEDEGSPRGVLEACVRGFESKQPPELETSCSNSRARSHWGKFFKLWKKKSVKRLSSFHPIGVPKIPKWKSKSTRENFVMSNVHNLRSSLVTFSLSDLIKATNNFSNGMLSGDNTYFSQLYHSLILVHVMNDLSTCKI